MQTLDRDSPLGELSVRVDHPRRRSGLFTVGAIAAAIVVAAGAFAFGISQSTTKTKTVVKTVTVAPKPAAAKKISCLPGAAKGSCNTDEAAEALIPDQPLDATTRATLAYQLVIARAAALKYPTVADALRAGMLLAGQFSPLTGAHYINISGAVGGPFNPANPGSLIYDGTSPTTKLIGAMYLSSSLNPPDGFAGPNDHWHRHSNTCVIFAAGKIVVPFAADSSVTKTQCDNVHGDFMRRTTWMVHAWVVPGWESPSGVFSHDNADVKCADGTIKTDAVGFCKGT